VHCQFLALSYDSPFRIFQLKKQFLDSQLNIISKADAQMLHNALDREFLIKKEMTSRYQGEPSSSGINYYIHKMKEMSRPQLTV